MSLILKVLLLLGIPCTIVPVAAQTESSTFPNELGKQLIQQYCNACRQLNRITGSSGYSRNGWHQLANSMIDLSNNPDQAVMMTYLATHFPPNINNSPILRSGNTSINFKEWIVPTLGQRSRDPI